MDSSDLYHLKQQFHLSAYKSVVETKVPDASSSEHVPTLLYICRAHIALNNPQNVLELVSEDTDELRLKAVRSLAKYVAGGDNEAALEELRDLCVEVEDAEPADRNTVKVLAATAFAREGEVEEALETLGVGEKGEDLEATALIVQIYLSISRPDLAKKEYESALKWGEDDLLLQSIEATIGLVAGGSEAYSNSFSFYSEQLANPSLTSPKMLTTRGVVRIMRNEIAEAKSDLEEALKVQEEDETLCAMIAATGISGKKGEADALYSKLSSAYPQHPMVLDVKNKADEFDELASKFSVPPVAAAA